MIYLFLSIGILGFAEAKDFIIYNTSNTAQNYFVVNGTSGATTGNFYGTWNGSSDYYTSAQIEGFGFYNLTDFNIGDYLPYTGATSNLVLGDNNLSVGTSDFFVDSNTGNVGIGTTAPGYPLEVAGTIEGDKILADTFGSASAPVFSFDGDQDIGMWREGTNNLAFATAGSERVRITSSGNVGIGTTAPGAILDVRHTNNNGLWIGGDPAGAQGSHIDGIIGGSLGTLYLNYNSGGNVILAQGGGNVGIGTTAPEAQITVTGGEATDGIINLWTDDGDDNADKFRFRVDTGDYFLFEDYDTGAWDPRYYLYRDGGVIYHASEGTAMTFELTADQGDDNGDRWQFEARTSEAANSGFGVQYYGTGSWVEHLTIDSTDGNVGIGTTAPAGKLDVKVTATSGTIDNVNDYGANRINIEGLGAGSTESAITYNAYTAGYPATAGGAAIGFGREASSWDTYMAFYTNNLASVTGNMQENMRINSDGNVGIGTTAPGYKLDVAGTSNFEDTMTFNSNGGPNGVISFGASTFYMKAQNGATVSLLDDASNGLHVIDGGNVGIGTTGPGAKLHVSGGDFLLNEHKIDSGFGVSDYMSFTNPNGGTTLYMFSADGYYSEARSDQAHLKVYGPGNSGDVISITHDGSDGVVSTGSGDLVLSPSTGNVGIGTTSPSELLAIEAATTADFLVKNTGTAAVKMYGDAARTGAGDALLDNSALWNGNRVTAILHQAGADTTNKDEGRINFYTSRAGGALTQAMIIDEAGNVGIGTTAPGAKLEVTGPIAWTGSSPAAQSQGALAYGSGQTTLLSYGANSTTRGKIAFQILESDAGNGINAMFIDTTGNVGIGTTSPGSPLNFATAVGDKISLYGTATPNWGFGIQSALMQIHSDGSGGDIAFGYGSSAAFTENVRFEGTGNVGIGTTAPGAKLDIAGDVAFGANSYGALQEEGTAVRYRNLVAGELHLMSHDGNEDINVDASGFISFETAGSEQVRIDSSGNVGIGTTAPDNTLEIEGTNIGVHFDSNGNFNMVLDRNAVTSNNAIQFETADALAWAIGLGDSSITGFDGTEFFIGPIADGQSAKFVIETSGNVGIGTTGPGAKLEIYTSQSGKTTLGGSRVLKLVDSNGALNTRQEIGMGYQHPTHTYQPVVLGYIETDDAVQTTGDFYIATKTNTDGDVAPTERFRITNSGNVGIGTTGPGGLLQVGNSTTGGGQFILAGNANSGDGASMNILANGVSKALIGRQSAITGSGNINNLALYSVSDAVTLYGAGTLSLTANSTGVLIPGNVGIGTTAPGAKFHTYDGASGATPHSYARLIIEDDTHEALQFLTPNTSLQAIMFGDPEDDNSGQIAYDHSDNEMAFKTNATEALKIQGDGDIEIMNGNVGIGTTAPLAKFHQYVDTSTTAQPTMIIEQDGTGDASTVYTLTGSHNWAVGSKNSDNSFRISKASDLANSNALTIDTNSNVGIGTTTPGNLLHLKSDAANGQFRMSAGTETHYWDIGREGQVNGRFTFINAAGGAATERMSILTTGEVGIGTAGPVGKTHIYSGASGQAAAHANGDELVLENNGIVGMTFLSPAANSAQILFGQPVSTARGIIMYDNSNDKLQFGTTNAVADMTIDTSGNVGIGTTSPTNKLTVIGAVNATGYIVNESVGFSGSCVNVTYSGGIAINCND